MIAKLKLSWPSLALLKPVEIVIGLPAFFSLAKTPFKCIWALHCAMQNGDFFFDTLGCSNLVEKEKVAIIAPSLGNGFFINSEFEAQADFLDELADQLPMLLPLSTAKKDNNVIGVSMGGFGAIRWALESGRFESATAISGVFDCLVPEDQKIYKDRSLRALHHSLKKIMAKFLLDADGVTREETDFSILAHKHKSKTNISLFCGDRDYISLNQTLWLDKLLKALSWPVNLKILPGSHETEFWKKAFSMAAENIIEKEINHVSY